MKNQIHEDLLKIAMCLDNIYKEEDIADEIHFRQTWGSTCLGFGGCGGDCMTSAYTSVIVKHDGSADVLFNGRKAYSVKNMNDNFKHDLLSRYMKPVYDIESYKK